MLLAAATLLGGCDAEAAGVDDSALFGDLVAIVFVPTLASFEAEAAALASAAAALEASPSDATLAAAQAAWRAARKPWKQSRAFGFGPTKEADGSIDWAPVKTDTIEELVASKPSFDAADVAAFGTSAKGLMALEYFLFDADAGQAAVLARLATAADAAPRRSLVRALADDLSGRAVALRAAWDALRDDLEAAGRSGRGRKKTRDDIVNQLVFQADVTANDGLAAPLGLKTGGTLRPDLEIARRSDNTLEDVADEVRGIENVWLGSYGGHDGLGVGELVREKVPELDADVRAALAEALAAIANVPPPLRSSLASATDAVRAAFDAVIALKKLLAADVVATLGVTLKVGDNDGD